MEGTLRLPVGFPDWDLPQWRKFLPLRGDSFIESRKKKREKITVGSRSFTCVRVGGGGGGLKLGCLKKTK